MLYNTMIYKWGGVTQWLVCTTRIRSVVSLNPIIGSQCFLERESLLSLLSTGWFQEQIQV